MTVMLVILAAAAASMGLARWLKLPFVPMWVLGGMAVSAAGLVEDPQLFQDALLLGLAFLVFSAGTEMSPSRVDAQMPAAILVGLAQFFCLAGAGLGATWLLGFDLLVGLYIALALAASSTLVVIRLLKIRQQLFEPFGRMVVGVLLLQDLLIILLISALGYVEEGLTAALVSVNGTLGLMLLAYVGLKWVTPWLLLELSLDNEERLLVVLATLFLFMGASYLVEVPLVVGAFLAGVSLSSFPVSGIFRGELTSISDFFLAIFFVTLGTTLLLPAWRELLLALTLTLLALLITPPLVYLLARRAGLTARSSLEGGLLLAQTSEFSLVVGLIGVQQGNIDESILSVIALVTVATMILTPFLATGKMTIRLIHWVDRWRRPAIDTPPHNHILLLGCGEHGLELLKWLLAHKQQVVVVDDDSGVVEQVEELGAKAILGDAADPVVLALAGIRQAQIVVSTLRRLSDNEVILKHAGSVKTLYSVFEPAEAERLRRQHGAPILESHLAARDLLAWFDRMDAEEWAVVAREKPSEKV